MDKNLWSEIKVSFDATVWGYDDSDELFAAWESFKGIAVMNHINLDETYSSPIALIAIFDFDRLPTESDIIAINGLMNKRKTK